MSGDESDDTSRMFDLMAIFDTVRGERFVVVLKHTAFDK